MTTTIPVAETRASQIFNALDLNFTLPEVNLSGARYQAPTTANNPIYQTVEKINVDMLTDGTTGGDGAFETLMRSMKEHLQGEYEKGRITGDQYTKAYLELVNLAMSTATQMVLGSQQAYWQALLTREQAKRAEAEAVGALVQLETMKAQLAMARYQAELTEAQMALTKMQLASEDARYKLTYAQIDVTKEQREAARAQHSDTKSNGQPVRGSIHVQNQLQNQQREAFIRDADARVAKMYLDSWSVRRTTDENTVVPSALTDNEISEVMYRMRFRAGMVAPADD